MSHWTISPRLACDNQRFPLCHYLFHESVGFTAVATPKVGCTTLKRWSVSLAHPEALNDPNLEVHQYTLDNLALFLRPPEETARILKDHPVLAFAREPAERLRSAYLDKFLRYRPERLIHPARELLEDLARCKGTQVTLDTTCSHGPGLPAFPASTAVNYARGLTFREFVDYVCAAPPDCLDPHWRPQSSFLKDTRIDLLVPLDAMNATLDALADRLARPDVRTRVHNDTEKTPCNRGPLSDTLSSEICQLRLRPPLSEIADSAILDTIARELHEDSALHARAQRDFQIAHIDRLLGTPALRAGSPEITVPSPTMHAR